MDTALSCISFFTGFLSIIDKLLKDVYQGQIT